MTHRSPCRFAARDALAAAARMIPAIDARRLRADLDAFVEQALDG